MTRIQRLLAFTTKTEALDLFREINKDPTLSLRNMAETLGYSRQAAINWSEILSDAVRYQLYGRLMEYNLKLEKESIESE